MKSFVHNSNSSLELEMHIDRPDSVYSSDYHEIYLSAFKLNAWKLIISVSGNIYPIPWFYYKVKEDLDLFDNF